MKKPVTVRSLYDERTITKKQFNTARNGSNPRATDDGDLWINLNGRRILIDRRGQIVFDGKAVT